MALTTTSQLSPNIQGFYDRSLLDRLVTSMYHVGYGTEKPLPKNEGTMITFRRYANLSAATTALTEGVTPTGSQLSKTDYQATIAQYGDFITLTDWVNMVGLDGNLTEKTQILGDQAADTHDQLCRNVMVAGSQVRYANDSARASVNTVLAVADLQYAQNLLERASVKTIKERITPGPSYNSFAIDPGYIAIGHTDLRKDIEAVSGFIKVKDYASPGMAVPGEIGSYGQIRFVLTPNAKIWAGGGASGGSSVRETSSNADVYALTIFGVGFYGNTRLGKKSVTNIVQAFGSGGTTDPLKQRATTGWKSAFVTKILDDTRAVRIEAACSSLA